VKYKINYIFTNTAECLHMNLLRCSEWLLVDMGLFFSFYVKIQFEILHLFPLQDELCAKYV